MDNDLMARRLRPPAEPSKPAATSSVPFAPVPSTLPWETEPPPPALREEIPWDTPAAEAWPPDPAADELAATASSPSPAPTNTFEPAPPDSTPAPAEASLLWPPVADASSADAAAAETDTATETDTAAVANPGSAPEATWDRPSDDDFDRPMDARADGPSWDEPSPFADFDDSPIYDDRPPDMLEAFHSPVAVAAEGRPREERTVDAAATTYLETERETDAALADPYDEAAPVVAEVAESAPVLQWPSWNSNGAAATADDESTAAPPAVAQTDFEAPVTSAFIPWDETAPEDPPQLEPAPTPAAVITEPFASSAAPGEPDDLFASPPVSEDELPEPDEVAPWDFVANDDQAQLFESSVAEVATVDFESFADVQPMVEADAMANSELFLDADTEPKGEAEWEPSAEADPLEAWLALAAADVVTETTAEPDMVGQAEVESEAVPEHEMLGEPDSEMAAETDFHTEFRADDEPPAAETEPEQVQIDIPAPSAFPATIYASGPESGLPANVVLRIELSIVDDAKRLNVTNVASASEFAPRVDEITSVQAAEPPEPATEPATEPAQAAEQVVAAHDEDSAWPAIWDPDRPTTGLAGPGATAEKPSDAWAWTDPTLAPTPYGQTSSDTWPEVDRPQDQDAFADSDDMAPAMPLAPLAPLAVSDESANASASQAASPRISTIAEPQSDLWFPPAEPETVPAGAGAETAVDKPGMSLLTVGLTIGMAIVVIVLVLVFIQLMTSLLG